MWRTVDNTMGSASNTHTHNRLASRVNIYTVHIVLDEPFVTGLIKILGEQRIVVKCATRGRARFTRCLTIILSCQNIIITRFL